MTASATMSEWLDKIPGTYKALAALGAVLVAGFTAGATTHPFSSLPEKVEEVGAVAARNAAAIDSLEGTLSEFMENAELTACLQVTESVGVDYRFCTRKGADWRSLLQ